MDGILVAYHNTRKIFGFQYISREEMDSRLFGSSKIGDRVFRNALFMFESVLNEATKKYPKQTLRISLDSKTMDGDTKANIFVEAVPENMENIEQHDETDLEEFFQTNQEGITTLYEPYPTFSMYSLKTRSFVNSKLVQGPLNIKSKDRWSIDMNLKPMHENDDEKKKEAFRAMRRRQATVYLPKSNKENPLMKKMKDMSDRVLEEEKKKGNKLNSGIY